MILRYICDLVTTEEIYAKNKDNLAIRNAAKVIIGSEVVAYNFANMVMVRNYIGEDLDLELYVDSPPPIEGEKIASYKVKSGRIYMEDWVQKLVDIGYIRNSALIPYEDAIQVLAGIELLNRYSSR